MIHVYRLMLVLSLLLTIASAPLRTEPLSSALAAKLHPALRGFTGSHERIFRGSRVFDVYGTAPEEIGVLVYTSDIPALRRSGIPIQSVVGNIASARIHVSDLDVLCGISGIVWIDPGSVNYPSTDMSVPETGATLVHDGSPGGRSFTGKDAIVLIYDTGIDFRHPDFRGYPDQTHSRILSIWDQTLTPSGSEKSPTGFTYGVEYSNAQIEAELKTSPPGFVRERDLQGHGTHVAGIAAGNGSAVDGKFTGMAPDADIVVVKGGNGAFSEVSMIDGLHYAENIAAQYNKPVVVNWSIGGQEGSHDGTRPYEIAVNNFVANSGRVVCISAGNDGASLMHKGGTIGAGASDTLALVVPFYTPASGTENDYFVLDTWTRSSDALDAAVISPDGIVYVRPSETDGDGPDSTNGTISLWNHNAVSQNSKRNIELYVHDKSVFVPRNGRWRLALKNISTAAVQYDAWLVGGTIGGMSIALEGGDNRKTVSMPGTAAGAVTVAAYVTKWSWPSLLGQYIYSGTDRTNDIALFSSIGPTADGREKPDIAAPGQGIVSAMSSMSAQSSDSSFRAPGGMHYLMSGTSMASPHVTGACALLLSADRTLSAAQIKSLLQSTADNDSYTLNGQAHTWGSGKLDAVESMARLLSATARVSRTMLAYDSSGANIIYTLTGATQLGVRLSPGVSGTLSRAIVNVTTQNNRPIAGNGGVVLALYADNQGTPGVLIGTAAAAPLKHLSSGTMNTVPLSSAKLQVEKGKDYFLVVSLSNSGDTLKLRTDGAVGNVRSFVMKNGAWSKFANNFRIRAEVLSTEGTDAVAGEEAVPLEFALHQNYPNPFNPSTVIGYTTPKNGLVTLKIFDVLGREVCTLVHGVEPGGRHTAVWNGKTSRGILASAGVYFYRLESFGRALSNKMLLLK
jgi:minor extracellular serine protease Vpr